MLLDTNFALYVWVGKLSNLEDQRLSIKTAIEYLQAGKSISGKYQNPRFTSFAFRSDWERYEYNNNPR